MRQCDRRNGEHVRGSEATKRAAKINGIGALGASAFTAGVGDFMQFKSGSQFSARLGIVPRQNSSGGKTGQGHIFPNAATPTCARCRSRGRSSR